ncbi:MAG: ABC transporter permease [Firmicutes bacterium]|nr:ABC transporter permease [Bacillota bacterium]MBR6585528.1 ABC transporter permease [Bacillota bacterium]
MSSSIMKIGAFAIRTVKEIVRDPLSYIFALGFPVVMLIIMTIVNESIPAEAGMDIFRLPNLAAGVVIFGFTFVMLFTTILVSKDRCSAFFDRMQASPVTGAQFLAGYVLPVIVLGVVQCVITYGAAMVIALVTGAELDIAGLALSIVLLIPVLVMFTALGVLFGCVFSEKAAPGVSSVLITVATILGGVWMDIKTVGGVLYDIASLLPFMPAVELARGAAAGTGEFQLKYLWITVIYATGAVMLAAAVFGRNMRKK